MAQMTKKSHTDLSTRIRKQALKLQQENKSLQTQDKRTGSETMSQKVDKQEDKYRNFVPERHLDCPDTKKPSSCASLLGWQDVPHLARKMGREPPVLTLYYTPHQRELSCPNLTCEQSNQDHIMVKSNQ